MENHMTTKKRLPTTWYLIKTGRRKKLNFWNTILLLELTEPQYFKIQSFLNTCTLWATQTTQMRKNIIILTLTLLLFACNSKTDKKSTEVDTADSSTSSLTNINSERFFPETKATEKFDTLIADKQLQVTIIRTDLDSYVVNEYEDNGKKQIDKYRDEEIALTIKQNSQILLDTIFRKEQFSKYGDNGFMDIAIFHNYWFNKLDKDKIEFFGVINKPETDWTIDFHHYFDLKNRNLTFIQEANDEE
jgi:Domain of unknown function (DUF4738)